MPITNTLTVDVKSPASPFLGVGIAAAEDWQDSPYVNIAKTARGFNNNSTSADSQGNLTGISGTGNTAKFVISAQGDDGGTEGTYRNGAYTLMWDGAPSAGLTAGGNVVFDSAANPAGTNMTLTFEGNMSFDFTNVDAADKPRKIRIIKDDEMAEFNSGLHLRQRFIDTFISTPTVVRMMSAMETNGSSVVDFADYPQVSWQTWAKYPPEVMCELANRLGCNLWINIPHQATDACVSSLFTALENNLDAGLRIRSEYSNEIWNSAGAFTQTQYCKDQAVADWGVGGDLSDGINWGMKRFVECMEIAQGISSRVDGYIGLWASGSLYHVDYMDAPTWAAQEPGNYSAPHLSATSAGPTHYFGDPVSFSTAIESDYLAEVGTGDFTKTKLAARQYWTTAIETTKGYLDAALAACTATDTVNGGNRSLILETYEGGQHTQMGGTGVVGVWHQVPAIFDGMEVGFKTHALANGRVYQSLSTSGTVGATFPSHTDGSDQTINGISWRDLTGQAFAAWPGGYNLRAEESGAGHRLGDPTARWAASESVTDGDRRSNSTGLAYIIGTTGTTGATEPTHTSGTQTVDGIDYTVDGSSPNRWAESESVTDGDQRINSDGIIYDIGTTGTTGTTEPTHTSGTQTVEGIDYTFSDQLNDATVRWNANALAKSGDRLVNSNGLVYVIETTGTTGSTEPTHTSGTQTIDGIDYRSDAPWLGENNYSLDYVRLCDPDLMYGPDMVAANIQVYLYLHSLGGFPTMFTNSGRASKNGFWGTMSAFDDVGPDRHRELWQGMMGFNATTGAP